MDTFAYSRCVECDEEQFFRDGLRCARCLGVSHGPIENEECADNTEESPQIPSELLAAA
jgi:hypothetical protein